MKIVHKQDIDATGVAGPALKEPPDEAYALGSLINDSGDNSIVAWFEGAAIALNPGLNKIRNLGADMSSNPQYDALYLQGTPTHQIVTLDGVEALSTNNVRYNFARAATDWTIGAVFRVNTLADGTNTTLFGQQRSTTGWTNAPSMNIDKMTGGGYRLRLYGSAGHTNVILNIQDQLPNITTQFYSVVMSQSVRNGATCRINGVVAGTNTLSAAKAQSTGAEPSLFGSDAVNGSFNGVMASLVLLNEDVTDSVYKLGVLERYLDWRRDGGEMWGGQLAP